MVISYKTDPAAIREALPEPLEPAGDTVAVQWLDLPDGEGFGAYSAVAQIIPCTFKGEPCNFVSQMYVDNSPPLAGGREIWGYPMKYGKAVLKVHGDTLTGTLHYADQQIARGTMVYKHDAFRADLSKEKELLARTQITLKLIPDIDGKPAIAQLVGINFADVVVQGRLDRRGAAGADPVGELPAGGPAGAARDRRPADGDGHDAALRPRAARLPGLSGQRQWKATGLAAIRPVCFAATCVAVLQELALQVDRGAHADVVEVVVEPLCCQARPRSRSMVRKSQSLDILLAADRSDMRVVGPHRVDQHVLELVRNSSLIQPWSSSCCTKIHRAQLLDERGVEGDLVDAVEDVVRTWSAGPGARSG